MRVLALSFCRPERLRRRGGLGWAEGRGNGKVGGGGGPDERGDLKEKQRGAGRESQGPDPAEGAASPPPLRPTRYLRAL